NKHGFIRSNVSAGTPNSTPRSPPATWPAETKAVRKMNTIAGAERTAAGPGESLSIATSEADARAAEAVRDHHAAMAGALELKGEALLAAARSGEVQAFRRAQEALVAWCRTDLVPHALAEERTLYAAASEHPDAKLLVIAMLAEHAEIVS